jgi:hypothetical protein
LTEFHSKQSTYQMNNDRKLLDLTAKIHQLDSEHENLYTAKISVESARATLEANGLASVLWLAGNVHPRGDAGAGADEINSWFARGGGQDLEKLARLDAASAALSRHARMASAIATLEPLCAERDALVAAIAAEKLEIETAQAAAQEARRLATEKALASVESDPALVAAEKALERFNGGPGAADMPLTRGKIEIGKRDDNDLVAGFLDAADPAPRPQRRQPQAEVVLAPDPRPNTNWQPPIHS